MIDQLTASFQRSEKLQKHVRFLYSKGSLYKVFNGNLLFHGCVPMTEDGQLLTFTLGGRARSGKSSLILPTPPRGRRITTSPARQSGSRGWTSSGSFGPDGTAPSSAVTA